jgi:hypothetical protein
MKKLLVILFALLIAGCTQSGDSFGATPVLTIKQGGTGTSTPPGANLLIMGNGTGYSYVATTSLGYNFPSTASTSNWETAYSWGNHSGLYDLLGQATSTLSSHTSTYNHTNYNTAYSDRLKWDGGATDLVAATGRTSLGLTDTATLASTTFYLSTNPSGYITSSSLSPYLTIANASTTYAPLAGSTTITTLGTITTGVWNAGGLTSSGALTANGTGDSYIAGRLGIATSTHYPSSILTMASSSASYLQAILKNTSVTASSSADFVLDNASSTDTSFFLNLGYNGTGFSQPATWTINGARDGYLYVDGGNLSLGVSSSTKYLNFFTGGTLLANERMRIDANGNVAIGTTSASSRLDIHGTTTGAGISFQVSNSASNVKYSIYDSGSTTIGTTTTQGFLTVAGKMWANVVQAVTQFFLPTSATLPTNTAGEMGIDTTSNQLRYFGTATSTIPNYQDKTITIASSTWNSFGGTATSTLSLGFAVEAQTWSSIGCYTDTATTTVNFGDGTNWMADYVASTTPSLATVASNNTFTNLEKIYVRISRFSGSPNQLSCTIKRSIDPN